MASRYEKFFDTIWNYDINNNQKGYIDENIKEQLTFSDDIIYEIPLRFQFRPENIARSFYGNPKLYWVLVYANEIEDSPAGFYTGRKIRIPRLERITEVI